jgi:glycerol-3-phosphate acyltransferase PlsX
MYSDTDVVVSDGFTGNIAVKSIEGCGKAVSTIMNAQYKRNLWTKLRAALSMDIIKGIKHSLDYKAVGGAMFLGLTKPVVKGHGNTEARSVPVYVQQAANAVRGNMIEKMKTMIDEANEKLAALEAKQAAEAAQATATTEA